MHATQNVAPLLRDSCMQGSLLHAQLQGITTGENECMHSFKALQRDLCFRTVKLYEEGCNSVSLILQKHSWGLQISKCSGKLERKRDPVYSSMGVLYPLFTIMQSCTSLLLVVVLSQRKEDWSTEKKCKRLRQKGEVANGCYCM
eukprot:Gb_09442 [translate_table: standard]